jgi:hypothetical protein
VSDGSLRETSVILRDFWLGEDITKNFLISLVKSVGRTDREIVISSVFPKKPSFREKGMNSAKYRLMNQSDIQFIQKRSYGIVEPVRKENFQNIWFTGENRRPPHDDSWDVFLSFELDHSLKKNIYLPLWVTRIDGNFENARSKMRILGQHRVPKFKKTKFACAFVGNPEPMRLRFIREFSKYFKIDLFGSVFNNRVDDKIKILKDYRFNICFENDLFPGYVTEKVFESWASEAIPVWWGLDSAGYLNSNSLVDVTTLGFDGALQTIESLSSSEALFNTVRREPILAKQYDLIELKSRLQMLLAQ